MTKPLLSNDMLTGLALLTFGTLLFVFGAGLDLTGIGLPAGIGADAIGVLMMLAGARKLTSRKGKLTG